MTKIQIKTIWGSLIYESEKETLKEVVIEKYKIDANLRDANLYGANLRDANLYGANLCGANLYGANLRDANLYGANLYGANLYGADLCGANLYGANLCGANLRDANLYGANLRDANLYGANLCGANLRDANLYGANLRDANLYGANLCGANLYGANLWQLPKDYINQCSRDILSIFSYLQKEVPFLKEKLLKGEVDGSTYEEGDCVCLIGTLARADGGMYKVCQTIPFYEKGTHNFGEMWFLNIRKGDTPENNQFSAHVLKLIEMFEKQEFYTITYEPTKEELETWEAKWKK